MAEFNLGGLSPDEARQLMSMLQEQLAGEGDNDSLAVEGAEMGNPDAEQDQDLIRRMIAEAIGPISMKLDLLCEVVDDEIIGGVTQLAAQREKMAQIEALKTNYGEQFPEEMQSFYHDATDGQDLFDKLHEEISGRKSSTPDWSDEMEGPAVAELAGGLKEKMLKLRGPVAEAPVAVEVSKVETSPASNPRMDEVVKKIRQLKKSNVKTGY